MLLRGNCERSVARSKKTNVTSLHEGQGRGLIFYMIPPSKTEGEVDQRRLTKGGGGGGGVGVLRDEALSQLSPLFRCGAITETSRSS